MKKNRTRYLVLDYKGEEYRRFRHLVKHLFETMGIMAYHIYQGRQEENIRVFVEVDNLTLEEADKAVQEISENLKQKLTKRWKCLPLLSLPEAYNIVTLPYKSV